jgi:hypothetical protein
VSVISSLADSRIISIIDKEFRERTFGTTQQYLEIYSPVYLDGELKVARIDREKGNQIIAYLPIHDEQFYFAVYIDTDSSAITGVGTEACYKVSFRVTSAALSESELSLMTQLKSTNSWDKGSLRKSGASVYDFSAVEFVPNPEPDELEDKLTGLLYFLEQDKGGVLQLLSAATGYISIAAYYEFNGNKGIHLENKIIKRLNDLNLAIDIDQYICGKPFTDQ